MALLTSSCWVAGFGVRSVAVTAVVVPIQSPPNIPGVQLPLVQLESNGRRVSGTAGEYQWTTGQTSWAGGLSTWSPNLAFPGTLAAQVGRPISVVVTSAAPPVVVWLTGLDRQGLPVASDVLTSTANLTLYTPRQSGQYTLLVKALWSYDQFVSYLFSVSIQP